MQEIIGNYGLALLELLGMLGIVAILFSCVESGGILSDIVANYMRSICG